MRDVHAWTCAIAILASCVSTDRSSEDAGAVDGGSRSGSDRDGDVGLVRTGDDASTSSGDAGIEAPDAHVALDAAPDGPRRADFGIALRPPNKSCKAPARPAAAAPVKVVAAYTNLSLGPAAMQLVQRPQDGSRWYLVRRDGTLGWFPTENPTTITVAANLGTLAQPIAGCATESCVDQGGEGGFLSLVFHPKFSINGKAYVSFTAPGYQNANALQRSVLAELSSTDGGNTFTGYRTLLMFDSTLSNNHRGGGLAFGHDGYLYASFGDAGSQNDAFSKGQTTDGFFSKVLRIDVDGPKAPGREYGIPTDNPFVGGGGEPAVFAYGFRNPYRISIDRGTGELWVGDVGQSGYEEVDHVGLGGNYGWPCREGTHDYLLARCPNGIANVFPPLFEHFHDPPNYARAIIGGVVYRGKSMPSFTGTYVYADWARLELWGLTLDPNTGAAKSARVNPEGPWGNWVWVGEDADGEVYALALQNTLFKLVPGGVSPVDPFPSRLTKTGCLDTTDPKHVAPGLIPYGVNAPQWSDGKNSSQRWLALPDGGTMKAQPDGDLELPLGSVALESFSVRGQLVETRMLVRHDDGNWAGYSYEWDDAQTEATLLVGSKRKTLAANDDGPSTWYFPDRGECMRCHTKAAGSTLGLEVGQLNGDFVYPATGVVANQLQTLEYIGAFNPPLGKPAAELPTIPALDGPGALESRARGYLHANCSQCHRPQGGGSPLDLRFTTALANTATCNVDSVSGAFGIAGAKIIVPGDPTKSLLSIRPHLKGASRMPPLASSVVDTTGLEAVDAWITSLAACP